MTGKGFSRSSVKNVANERRWLRGTAVMLVVLVLLVPLVLHPTLGEAKTDNLTLTIPAGDYRISNAKDGYAVIEMEGFGALGVPGEPQLPAKTFMIALPPGAKVQRVDISADGPVPIEGAYEIIPVKPTIPGAFAEDGIQVDDLERAEEEYQTNYDATYGQNNPYPEEVGSFWGQGQWRKYTYASVKFHPFQYQPRSGRLLFYPSFTVSIDYTLPEPQSAEWQQVQRSLSDNVMEDMISEWLVNYEEAQSWYQTGDSEASLSTDQDKYDYVIIVRNEDMASAVAPLKTWKEQIGHSVKVVTLEYIYANYTGDDAEKIWNFLHDHYSYENWGIKYVLLVGNINVLPVRFLFPSDLEWAYASDYYYAKLSVPWDVDGDNRWGEFQDDNYDPAPDVLVGRIPHNEPAVVSNICSSIIDFEQDTDPWKRNALLAMGVMDYNKSGKTDGAELGAYLKTHVFDPQAWSYTTLVERNGLSPSTYPYDQPLSETNFIAALGPRIQSVVNAVAHGGPGGMSSQVWHQDINGNNRCDPKTELTWNSYSGINNIPANLLSVAFLCGCSTGPPCNAVSKHIGSSLQIIRQPLRNLGRAYIINGAPAVIASSAGSDYCGNWSKPQDGAAQSLNYYFYDHLINKDKKVGDAFYAAMLQYANDHGLQRGIRVFYFLGDPSLTLKGIENRPGGTDTLIHGGPSYDHAADNADDGDMYVAVLTTNPINPLDGEIKIYKSTNHGQSWGLWNSIESRLGFLDIDVVVAEWGSGEFADNRLLVFCTRADGIVQVHRFPLAGGAADIVQIAAEGSDNELWHISVAREALAETFNLHLTYEIYNITLPSPFGIKVCRSANNGITWQDWYAYDDFRSPSIEAGVNDQAYLVAIKDNYTEDVCLKRSTDNGANWGSWTNLSENDGAYHHSYSYPVVAASTSAAMPTVWVAYPYTRLIGGWEALDIRYAYSLNGGADWTKDQILAGNAEDEFSFHMKAYKASANPWINISYITQLNWGLDAKPQVIWRYSYGLTPNIWSVPRIVNDFGATQFPEPRVVYSPGAPVTGSGVVYQGADKVYFSAPWLTDTSGAAGQPGKMELVLKSEEVDQPTDSPSPLGWVETVDLESAFAVSSLFQTEDGVLYAGTVTGVDETTNQGVVFRSDDGGETWERSGALEGCWSVNCVFWPIERDRLFAGGLMLEGDQAYGMIYRSQDGGDTWDTVLAFPDSVVYDIMQAANGDLYAATGWNGLVFKSEDGGEGWFPVAELGEGVNIYSIMQASNGKLFAALEGPGGGQIMRSENGEDWIPAEGLGGVEAVYDLIEGGDRLFAGVRGEDMGRVYQSDLEGLLWTPTAELPDSDIEAVHCLLQGPLGQIFAGTERVLGSSSTGVFVTWSQGEQWEPLGGTVDLANTVYALVATSDMIYASTGHVYGNVYKCGICGAVEPGDANLDGVVDVFDLVMVKRIILGLDPPTCGADANLDGEIDVFDLVKVKRIILGIDP